MATLFGLFARTNAVCRYGKTTKRKASVFYQDAKQRYEQRKVDPMRPLLSPEKLWLNVDEVNRRLKSYPPYYI
ncbi:transcription-repair-coupling factor [Haemophilus influenzae]|uniref:Transcription-repair-coupling factor n=1 Tax=Haemophilus influenzae TaxID=727 RepID=A0A2X1RSY8_HAEIF|nr:transcription-repair-coupling factor [Haemophilus influenzae]